MLGSSRREFLSRAVLAGAGATVVQPFTAAPAGAADPSLGFSDRPDPNFLIGRVIDAAPDGTLKVLTPEGDVRTARLDSATVYWKAGRWNEHQIVARDCVMGRGEFDANGVLHVNRVWANIMKIDGVVETLDDAARDVRLRASDKQLYEVTVTAETLGLDKHDRERDGDPRVVGVGEPAVSIAYRDPATGRLFAHRLESALADPEAPPPSDDEPTRPIAADSPARIRGQAALEVAVARTGNASYFCCNTSGGCGCGSAPAGFCSGCHSASWQIAWPKITGCTASCVGCCVPSSFPRYDCQTQLLVRNACQTGLGWIGVTIKDCGPNPRCRNTGCKGWDSVRFDLTACAFDELGGSFSIGHMNLQVSAPV